MLGSEASAYEYLEARAKEKPSIWAQYYRTLKGSPMRYMNQKSVMGWRHFLIQVMDDQHEDKVIKKARQLGFSEGMLNEVLWFTDTHEYTNIIYTFPRDKQLRPFSVTRADVAINESPHLFAKSPAISRSVYRKPIGTSNIHFTSAAVPELGEGTPCDALYLDEYDRMKKDIEIAFSESLSASPYRLVRRFSTPTIPTQGIARLYELSDQHCYFFKCEHCNHKQTISLDNIMCLKPKEIKPQLQYVPDGAYEFVCIKCKRELNRMQKGEWVISYPGRSLRGYKVSQLDAPWLSADDIMRKRFKQPEQLFRNYVLGEEYADMGSRVSEDEFNRCEDPMFLLPHSRSGCAMVSVGIDWGATNWVVVLGLQPDGTVVLLDIFYVEDTNKPLESVKQIASRVKLYEPDVIIGDFGFGADRNPYMLETFPGRAFACKYTDGGYLAKWNQTGGYLITANRVGSLKQLIFVFRRRGVRLPQVTDEIQILRRHVCNLVVVLEENDDGELEENIASMGPDDFAHAFNFAYLGIDREKLQISEGGGMDYLFIDEAADEPGLILPENGTLKTPEELANYWKERFSII